MQHTLATQTSLRQSGALLWSLAGFALYAVFGLAAIFPTSIVFDPLLEALGFKVEAGEVGLSVRNALEPIVWGVLVVAFSMPIGRRLVQGLRFSRAGWLVLAVGLLLAAVTWFLIEEFVRARYGWFDPEYVGFSLLTWPATVATALGGWAALAVPRHQAGPLVVAAVLGLVGFGLALAPSVPGALDGIPAESVPLAFAFGADAAYAILVAVVLLLRGRSSAG